MMSGQTVLVTGGAGYVGTHTVLELLSAGYEVVVIDNMANASMGGIHQVEEISEKKVQCYSVDLLDKPALHNIFSKHKFQCVMHFAGLKAVGESCELPLLYYRTNIGSTLNLLEVMKEHSVYDLVFSSSCTVFGSPRYLPVDEDHPLGGCTNPYGRSKYFIENILMDVCAAEKKWNVISLRYFNPVGAHPSGKIGEDPRGVPGNLMPYISQVAVGRRKELSVYGSDYDTPDGTAVRDYIHVVDLAQGHVAAIKKLEQKCGCKAYNLGSGVGYSVLDMIKAFERASRKTIPYKLMDRRAGDVGSCYADPTKAEEELGWRATKNLDQICEDLWRWQSTNPDGFCTQNGN